MPQNNAKKLPWISSTLHWIIVNVILLTKWITLNVLLKIVTLVFALIKYSLVQVYYLSTGSQRHIGNNTVEKELRYCIASSKRKVRNAQTDILPRLSRSFNNYRWLPVSMPSHCDYNCIIMENNAFQGSLHSFIRHCSEWRQMIAKVEHSWSRMSSAVKKLIKEVENGSTSAEQFLIATAKHSLIAETTCRDIQQEIIRFIKANMIAENYLYKRFNWIGQKQECFVVKDKRGKEWVMSVGISNPPFQSNFALFGNAKPIRSIVTIFFSPKADAKRNVFLFWFKLFFYMFLGYTVVYVFHLT